MDRKEHSTVAAHTPTPWHVDRLGKVRCEAEGGLGFIADPGDGRYANSIPRNQTVSLANAAFIVKAANCHEPLLAALRKATDELNAIRARDGAPQHIDWHRGSPIQTDACTHEYWDALTEECFAAIAKAEGKE